MLEISPARKKAIRVCKSSCTSRGSGYLYGNIDPRSIRLQGKVVSYSSNIRCHSYRRRYQFTYIYIYIYIGSYFLIGNSRFPIARICRAIFFVYSYFLLWQNLCILLYYRNRFFKCFLSPFLLSQFHCSHRSIVFCRFDFCFRSCRILFYRRNSSPGKLDGSCW